MADPAIQPTDTLFLGNLPASVDRDVLYEIGIQAGPVTRVVVPKDPATSKSKGFGFIVSGCAARPPRPPPPLTAAPHPQTYETVESASYAVSLFTGTLILHGKEVRVAFSPRGNTE